MGKLGGIYFSASVLRRFSRAPVDSAVDAADELCSEDYFSPPLLLCQTPQRGGGTGIEAKGSQRGRGPIVLASETQGTERAGVCRYRSGGGEGEWGGDNNPGKGGGGCRHKLHSSTLSIANAGRFKPTSSPYWLPPLPLSISPAFNAS